MTSWRLFIGCWLISFCIIFFFLIRLPLFATVLAQEWDVLPSSLAFWTFYHLWCPPVHFQYRNISHLSLGYVVVLARDFPSFMQKKVTYYNIHHHWCHLITCNFSAKCNKRLNCTAPSMLDLLNCAVNPHKEGRESFPSGSLALPWLSP